MQVSPAFMTTVKLLDGVLTRFTESPDLPSCQSVSHQHLLDLFDNYSIKFGLRQWRKKQVSDLGATLRNRRIQITHKRVLTLVRENSFSVSWSYIVTTPDSIIEVFFVSLYTGETKVNYVHQLWFRFLARHLRYLDHSAVFSLRKFRI